MNARRAGERPDTRPVHRTLRAASLLAAVGVAACTAICLTAACSSAPPATSAHASDPAKTATPVKARARIAPRFPVTIGPPHVTVSRVRTADGSVLIVAVFAGSVRYVLHNGSQDPGPAYATLVRAGPAVTGTERARLLAAFNGGFLMRSRAGGYEQEGHVFRALRHGLASLVIDRSGRAQIGLWGTGLPVPGEAVYSVRQNLWPLLVNGRPTVQAARWWRWGGTISHAEYVARSALGETASGELIYVAGMSTTPEDLAVALARGGARIGMELDINPEWVQLATAGTPGGPLTAAIPGQVRPATQYLTGWTRDFITVLAPEP